MTEDEANEIDTLGVGYHEVGHGLAGHLGRMSVRRMRIERSWWDGHVSCGYTTLDPPTERSPADMWRWYGVMLFAGQLAQLRYYDQIGHLTSAVQANIERGSTSDYEWWIKDRARISMTEAAVRKSTEEFLDHYWARITRLAERLARSLTLAGSAL